MTISEQSAVASAFAEIKSQAILRWQQLRDSGNPVIMVGTATCGQATGSLEVLQAIRDEVQKQGITCPVMEVGCMGHCYAEPIVMISKPGYPTVAFGRVNPVIAGRLVKDYILGDDPCLEFVLGALEPNDMIPSFSDFPRSQHENKIILKNCGYIDPVQIDHYIASGGYSSLVKAIQMSPEDIISEIKKSGLRGRGGAGFPTGQKWEICRNARSRTKYVICNADEGDPGAFMDRAILESDPHSVIEGMIIAAYAAGARHGYIYVRAEYPLAVKRLRIALHQAGELNLLGRKILGSDFSFDIKLFQGSGAFVCGEETALIASIEGEAGLPCHRPPYPATSGLYGKPTLINNVKTLAYVRHIIEHGAGWFSGIGTEKSKGTAVFALAGKVVNTGMVEVPMGTTLRQVIFDAGSGIPNGKHFKAVQIGGPSGGCLPGSALDLPVDFDSLRQAGAMMGSGGMVVLDEDDCMVEMARFFLEFTQRESCGKCTFCRLGTKQMLEALNDITKGKGKPEDIAMLKQLAQDVKDGSLCGFGRTVPNPILTTLRYFPDEYAAHINEKRCPAKMCPELISFYVVPGRCPRFCEICVESCAVEAISVEERRDINYEPEWRNYAVIDQDKCTKCGSCLNVCPPENRSIIKLSPPGAIPGAGRQ